MSVPELLIEPHSCPLAKVHARLDQAHRLWHEAERYYFDPELFPMYLNSAIQALRSVSWVLQKHKRAIRDFDQWYGPWQERLGADPLLRWLVQARNRVEKEGDLDGQSSAIVRLVDSYLENPSFHLTVKPWLTSAQIAEKLYEVTGPPPPEVKDASLIVERTWVENGLPEREVLDALAHCYGVLSELISDAHEALGLDEMKLITSLGQAFAPIPFHGGRLPCMIASEQARTTTIRVDTGEVTQGHFEPYQVDPSVAEKASARYGPDFDEVVACVRAARGLSDRADALFEMAKRMLVRDRYHDMVVMLDRGGEAEQVMRFRPQDRTEKFLMWRDVAKQVEITGTTTVITIGEAWYGRLDPNNPDRAPADDPERAEAIQLFAESMEGEAILLACSFERGPTEEIILGETEKTLGLRAAYMLPVQRVWAKWRDAGRAPERK